MKAYTHDEMVNWYNNLPSKPVASSVVAWNNQGEILFVLSSKDEFWGLPGGIVEENESPLAGACRELEEETGLKMYGGQLRLLGVNYAERLGEFRDFLHFYFSAGMLNTRDINRLGQASEKMHGCKFLSRHQISSHVAPHRLKAIENLFDSFNHDALYIETNHS